MSTDNYQWPQEQVDQALELRATGMSFQQIADALGLTKNTVLGKFNRLGLLNKKEKRISKAPIEFPLYNRCQFPYGDIGELDFRFCGEPVDLTIIEPYCSEHYKKCHAKIQEKV